MADQKNHSDTQWEGEGTERDSGPAVVAQPESDTGASEMVHGNEPSAPPKSWQNPNTGNVCEEPPTGATSGDTYTSTPRNVPTSNPIRTDGQMQTHTRHPSMLPDNTEFKSEADFVSQATVDTPTVPDIEGLVKRNPDKTGIAFLFVCTGSPDSKDYIDNCTAMTKMQVCFEEKLGYLTIPVGMNVTPHQLDLIIAQVEKLELPETYRRSLFYFFGHGNEKSVKFADGYVERQYIISKFQAICPQDSDKVFKIFIFDSCRTGNYITCHAQQETGELSGDKVWKQTGQYPASSNTLVINATQAHCKAFYLVENGCGLMTRFFTELAPTRNESLYDLLVAVRQEIVAYQLKKSSDDPEHTQVLVYEDNLMGVVHLLAESRGTARVAPIDVSASPSVCSTNVHWKFDRNVEKEIKSFKVEISPDTCSNDRDAPPSARTKTLSGLESGVTHNVKVVAIYSDGTRAKSTAISFTTPVRSSPSNIAVIPEYPGSPRARVQWSFAGESSDLNCFRVAVQDDEKEIMRIDVAAGSRRAGITGLRPFKTHQVTVIAVYRDDFQTQMNETFTPSDRCSPVDIKVVPDYAGSPNANITWSFMGQSSDISHFRITVETDEGGIVFEDKISKDDRSTTLKKMRPMTTHQVKVIAVYSDGIQNHDSVDFQHEERSYPEKVEVTQGSPGASEAAITWSFPEHISLVDLSGFCVSVKKVSEDGVICRKNVAAVNRGDTIDGLEPETKYAVTVAAHYKDEIVKERATEYETLDRSSPKEIRITQEIEGSGQAMIDWSFPKNCPALSRFCISATNEGEGRVVCQKSVTSQERRVTIDSLQPSTKYTVNVMAEYSDGIEKRRIKEHVNCELKAARNLTARLTRLNTEPKDQPPKVGMEIQWSYERREPLLVVDHFKVTATPADEVGKVPVPAKQDDPNRNSVEMKLEPGTTYSLQVVTYFEGNIEPQKSTEDKQVHTPTEEQAKLYIQRENDIIQSKSVSFTISDPPILQNKSEYSADRIQLTAMKYSKREVPDGGDDDEDQNQPETADDDFVDFKRDSTSDSASPTQPRRVTVDNLTPGRKYKMKLRAEYNTGDVIDSSEIDISTTPPSDFQKMCCCVSCSCVYLVLSLMFCVALAAVIGPLYVTETHGTVCATEYILSLDSVQCGQLKSRYYDVMKIEGSMGAGDTLEGTLRAWLVREKDLILHSCSRPAVTDGSYISEHTYVLLNGWQIYTWKDSIISGYCCISNNGSIDKTAHFYIFSNDEDLQSFRSGEGARNAILSDMITIPPNRQKCFEQWGAKHPFTVKVSSYYFMGVDIPAEMTYSSNIAGLLTYVNTSDYSDPHYFRFSNATRFHLHDQFLHQNDYVAICEAPSDKLTNKNESALGASSLHIRSCNEPHGWMGWASYTLAAVGGLLLLGALVLFPLSCYCQCGRYQYLLFKCRYSLIKCPCLLIKCYRRCSGYNLVQETGSTHNIQ